MLSTLPKFVGLQIDRLEVDALQIGETRFDFPLDR